MSFFRPIPRPLRRIFWLWSLSCLGAVLAQAQTNLNIQTFAPGSLKRVEQLPPSHFRDQLSALPAVAQQRAVAWLNEIPFTELDLESLRVDPAGGIYVACNFKVQEAAAVTQEPVTSAAAVAVSPFPSGLIFHSRPGSANVLYLNFGGESVSNTQWNVTYGQTVFNAIPFDTDGNASSYSDGEQLAIKRIWQRVAED